MTSLIERFGRNVPAGQVLFHEGEPGKEMFVIQSGKVRLSRSIRGQEKLLAELGAGEFFGEMSIINDKPRTATAVVLEDAQLLVLDPKTFEAMIKANTEIAVRMIKKLAERLSDADAQIENLLLSDPNSRIVHHMLQLCQSRGRQGEEGIEVDFPVRDLPRELAVGEPAIRFMVSRLERAGLVETSGDRLTVRDTARLFDFLRYLEMKWKFGEL
jgi:CRP/FNR family cyclic AMP-dependent transcriptional regulator